MNVSYSKFDTSYACEELARGLNNVLPSIIKVVEEIAIVEFADDVRKIYVFIGCPCCINHSVEGAEIIVSPFCGIDPDGLKMKVFDKYPPFRSPGKDRECENIEDFENQWRAFLKEVLSSKKESETHS